MPAETFTLPTSVPHNDAGLLDTVARIRSTLNVADPKSMYFGRPEAAAAAEANIQAAMLRAGVSDPGLMTAEQLAAQQHDQSYRLREMPAGLVETIDARSAAVGDLKVAVGALRAQIG